MTRAEDDVTYFAFDGVLTHTDASGDYVPLPPDEMQTLLHHILLALKVYEKDGFRFVDLDASGTLSDGKLRLDWCDYGLGVTE